MGWPFACVHLRQAAIAAALILLCVPRGAAAQVHRDPFAGVAIGGMTDVAREGIRTFITISYVASELQRDIAAARARFWATYPNAPGHQQARAEFVAQLKAKDEFYLASEIMKVGIAGENNPNAPSLLTIPTGGVDGGIPRPAQNAFMDWVNRIVDQMRLREGLGARLSLLSRPGRAEAILAEADPWYRVYVVRRDLDEFRRAGRRPPGVDAETWALTDLAFRAEVPDPYGAAAATATQPGRFMAACQAGLAGYLGGGWAPDACACSQRALREVVDPKLMWTLETRFTPEDFLLASFSRVGLHERVAACVRG